MHVISCTCIYESKEEKKRQNKSWYVKFLLLFVKNSDVNDHLPNPMFWKKNNNCGTI